mgnify:FL=1
MRMLNNNIPQKDLCLPVIEDGKVASWQSIVLFEHILDGERILTSPEINKLLRYFYGQAKPSVVRTNYSDDLQFWASHELYEADGNEESVIYPFKASLEEMRTDEPIIHNGEYSGPLNIVSFKPDENVERDFLAITCKWQDGLFRNDNFVIGIIADTDDLYNIIETWVIN